MATVVDRRTKFDKIMRRLKKLKNTSVDSGLLPDAGYHERSGIHYAQIMFINEFGEGNIPARPLFRFTFDENITTLRTAIRETGVRYAGEQITERRFLKIIGELHADLLGATIDLQPFEPNAPTTVKAKGFDFPLVETGVMRDSFSYRINI